MSAAAQKTLEQDFAGILARIFTNSTPCTSCGHTVPTFCDPEMGKCYCLTCLEDAVAESQAEILAERQEMARLACWGRQIAA